MVNDTPPHQKSEPEQQQRQDEKKLSPLTKRILIVDDDPDITFTFKKAFEEANRISGNKICFHVSTYIEYFVNLYRSAIAAGFNIQQVMRLLNIANNDLPAVENRCYQLRREEASLKFSNQKAAKAFQDLSNQIADEYKTLDQYRLFYKQQKQEINQILQHTGLQEYVEYFQKNNDVYLKIKETIKREVKYILTNPTNTKHSTCISEMIQT